jgi:hypothetical protein
MSDYTLTPHYSLYKPTVNADGDQWGDHWNANADTLDSVIYSSLGGGPFLPLSGGTATGLVTFSVAPNVTDVAGYMQAGQSIISVNNIANGPTRVGIGAGAAQAAGPPASDIMLTAVGWRAANVATGGFENTAVGTLALATMTGQNANTGIGVGALMLDPSPSGSTGVGNDVMRNTWNTQSCTAIGYYALAAGAPKNNTALGAYAQNGNSTSVIVGGTATAGDALQLTFAGSFTGSPVTVSYTVAGGNTTTQMATGLINAINTNSTLLAVPGRFLAVAATPAANYFGIQWNGTSLLGLTVTTTANVTGAATETLTIGTGNLGQNLIAIGFQAMQGLALTTASSCIAIGNNALSALTTGAGNTAIGRSALLATTSGQQNTAIGDLALTKNTTGVFNVALGQNTGATNDVGFNNTLVGVNAGTAGNGAGFKLNALFGSGAGQGITTGASNTIIGAMNTATSQSQVTTGGNNVAIGAGASVASQTATGQLSIQNAIYGTGNFAVDANVSGGKIGIFNRAPTALLTIGDNVFGAHIAVVATAPPAVSSSIGTPTTDARASDICGTVTGGTGSTGITITFEVQYATTVPHVVVTARDGLTFTYTVSQAAITITHAAATGRIFDYMVIQ